MSRYRKRWHYFLDSIDLKPFKGVEELHRDCQHLKNKAFKCKEKKVGKNRIEVSYQDVRHKVQIHRYRTVSTWFDLQEYPAVSSERITVAAPLNAVEVIPIIKQGRKNSAAGLPYLSHFPARVQKAFQVEESAINQIFFDGYRYIFYLGQHTEASTQSFKMAMMKIVAHAASEGILSIFYVWDSRKNIFDPAPLTSLWYGEQPHSAGRTFNEKNRKPPEAMDKRTQVRSMPRLTVMKVQAVKSNICQLGDICPGAKGGLERYRGTIRPLKK